MKRIFNEFKDVTDSKTGLSICFHKVSVSAHREFMLRVYG